MPSIPPSWLRDQWLLVVAVSIPLVGVFDWLTGPEVSTSILYLLPVAIAAAGGQPPAGMVVAVLCAVSWLALDLTQGRDYMHPAIPYWNGAVRLGIFVTVAVLVKRNRLLQESERALARTDPLTGAYNSRAFHEALAAETVRSRRSSRPLSLAYVDLDNFKAVNDRSGHEMGDRVLRAVADALRTEVRAVDVVARLGGDEFAILLVEADTTQAKAVLDRVRAKVLEAMQLGKWPVTLSVGVATFEQVPEDPAAILQAADALMYDAKRAGKNRISTTPHREGSS